MSTSLVATVLGVREFRGRLYAWGEDVGDRADASLAVVAPRIWVSDDGATWTVAASPTAASARGGVDPLGRITEMTELRGRLFAWGDAEGRGPGFPQPAVWTSDDGTAWARSAFPRAIRENTHIVDIVDIGDRFVALATGGTYYLGDISQRPTATMIYTSVDGTSWTEVDNTPGVDAGAHPVLLDVGKRLLAIGQDLWVSDDGGLSWAVSTEASDLGGRMTAAAQADGLIVGVGNDYHIEGLGFGGPALMWTSTDAGTTWTMQERSSSRTPYTVLFGDAGQAVVLGFSPLVVWISNDRGETWTHFTPATTAHYFSGAATAIPGGYAATGFSEREGRTDLESIIWTSPDGRAWQERYIDIVAKNIIWTPTFGLVVSGKRYEDSGYAAYVALGPNPFGRSP